MIEGKAPINYIDVSSVEMSPEGWKVVFDYKNIHLDHIGTFIATHNNMKVSPETEKLLVDLLSSLEKDIYTHLFESAPEEKESKETQEEKTFEEKIGVRFPENISLADEFEL